MTDLIKRLESAEAGSRLLDREVERAVGLHKADLPYGIIQTTSPVTTDLSAAVALVERVLDDPGITLERITQWDGWYANINVVDGPATSAKSLSAALALCIAAVKALKAKEV
jgi:hypothetical protein